LGVPKGIFEKHVHRKARAGFSCHAIVWAKQGKNESISEWIQNIQSLSSKFRGAALQDCEHDEQIGLVALADKLRNFCFVQGISSDRIQAIVWSRNAGTFDEIAETALEEESAIFSKNERYRQGANPGRLVCHNRRRAGHVAEKCYFKDKKDVRVSTLGAEPKKMLGNFWDLLKMILSAILVGRRVIWPGNVKNHGIQNSSTWGVMRGQKMGRPTDEIPALGH